MAFLIRTKVDMEKLERIECGDQISEGEEGSTENLLLLPKCKCKCVSVCDREKEKEINREKRAST